MNVHDVQRAVRVSPAARALLALLGVYRRWSQPRAGTCRYLPTCSTYAVEAIELHGAGRGLVLALRRVLRCHPWGDDGHDPVPEARRPEARES